MQTVDPDFNQEVMLKVGLALHLYPFFHHLSRKDFAASRHSAPAPPPQACEESRSNRKRNIAPISQLLTRGKNHAQVRDANSSQLEVTIWDSKEQRSSSGFMGECILNLSKLVPFQVYILHIFHGVQRDSCRHACQKKRACILRGRDCQAVRWKSLGHGTCFDRELSLSRHARCRLVPCFERKWRRLLMRMRALHLFFIRRVTSSSRISR